MKKMLLLMMGLLLVVLSACTTYIYGVPQETWERMSEVERSQAMEVHKQRQIARQQAAAERARQRAIYEEERRRQLEAEAEAERYRVESVYAGEGNYGDLIRVHIEDGMADFRGKSRPYDPVTFQIASGEEKDIVLSTTKRRQTVLSAYYDGNVLYLDGSETRKKTRSSQFHYDKRWRRGLTYGDIYTNNRARLKGAEVTISIVDDEPHRPGYRPPGATTIIIQEQPERVIVRERPETVIVREEPETIYIKEKPRKVIVREEPETIYVKEKPRKVYVKEKPEKVIVKERPRKVIVKEKPEKIEVKYDDHKFKARRDKLAKDRAALVAERKVLKKEQAQYAAELSDLKKELKQLTYRPKKRSLINQTEEEREQQFANVNKSQKVAKRIKAIEKEQKKLSYQQQQVDKKLAATNVREKEIVILEREIEREEQEYRKKHRR